MLFLQFKLYIVISVTNLGHNGSCLSISIFSAFLRFLPQFQSNQSVLSLHKIFITGICIRCVLNFVPFGILGIDTAKIFISILIKE